jgi:hypothetical protein
VPNIVCDKRITQAECAWEQGAEEDIRTEEGQMVGGWEKLHSELLAKYIRMITPRKKGWALHVARMEQTKNAYKPLVGKPK